MKQPSLVFWLYLFAATPLLAAAEETRSFYLIGNSLTQDTVPSGLDGDVQWHVDCGKSLPFIYENPGQRPQQLHLILVPFEPCIELCVCAAD
jgi:hypothetical protein